MRRTPPAAALAAVALALAGCGDRGSPSDESAIKTTVRDYFRAFADHDGAKACSELSGETQTKIAEAAKADNCAAGLDTAAKRPEIARYLDDFRHVEILEVNVAGTDASAKVKAIGETTTIPLTKEGGSWKIQGGDVAPGK
jgi:hypothetical protein